MPINSKIYEEIKRNNNIITTAKVVELGVSRSLLTIISHRRNDT